MSFIFSEKLNILFGQTNATTNCEEGRAEIFFQLCITCISKDPIYYYLSGIADA